jgi:hypothetical protein
MSNRDQPSGSEPKSGEIIFYTGPDGTAKVEVLFEDENFWLTQKRMADLFGVEVPTINYHLKEVFQSGELVEGSVIREIRITAADGKRDRTMHYSLDAIISVGYRVNSTQDQVTPFPRFLNLCAVPEIPQEILPLRLG